MEPTTPAAVDPPANVLFVASDQQQSDTCEYLAFGDADATLWVTFADRDRPLPDPESIPGQVGLVTIGDVLAESTQEPDFSAPVVTDSVADPTDIATIGITISRFCERWHDDGHTVTVCFDSLDSLLRYTPTETVFRFVHVLTQRFESIGAHAYFHFNPDRHEDWVVSTFGAIVDEVVAECPLEQSLPEATDEEMAERLEEWDSKPSTAGEKWLEYPMTEATDEEIANFLGE